MSKLGIAVAGAISLSMVVLAVYAWTSLSDVTMSASGYVALILGGIATVGLGVGLMVLVFYSNSKGFDDAAVTRRDDMDGPPS